MDDAEGWLEGPCTFYLARSYATKCCTCDKEFAFMNRGYTCEFCGHFCHNDRACSRKMWLSRELLRRRICSICDCYRKVCRQLRTGAEFVLYEKTRCRTVTMTLDESTGALLMVQTETGQRIDTVDLDRLEGVRRGFSLGGRLMTTNYDPLRSLAVTVKKSKRELTSYNLKANSAWSCQMWVDGLQSAKYVHRRMEDQQLAREWYTMHGRTPYTTGSRLLHNYLPKASELRQLRREKQLTKKASSSLTSNDSGVDSEQGSVENLNLDLLQLESYVDIDLAPDSLEVTSREIHPSVLFSRMCENPTLSCPVTSASTPTHPAHVTSSPLPVSTSDVDLTSRSTPGLPYATPPTATPTLCSCHAYQIITTMNRPSSSADRGRGHRLRSAGNSPSVTRGNRCCFRCEGHCRTINDLDNL